MANGAHECDKPLPPAWLGHAPNEFITLRHYLAGIKFAAKIYQLYGA